MSEKSRRAYVLINTEIGSESEVAKKLREIPDVTIAEETYGVYDIVAIVETKLASDVSKIVKQIRKVDNVRSTLTLQVISQL